MANNSVNPKEQLWNYLQTIDTTKIGENDLLQTFVTNAKRNNFFPFQPNKSNAIENTIMNSQPTMNNYSLFKAMLKHKVFAHLYYAPPPYNIDESLNKLKQHMINKLEQINLEHLLSQTSLSKNIVNKIIKSVSQFNTNPKPKMHPDVCKFLGQLVHSELFRYQYQPENFIKQPQPQPPVPQQSSTSNLRNLVFNFQNNVYTNEDIKTPKNRTKFRNKFFKNPESTQDKTIREILELLVYIEYHNKISITSEKPSIFLNEKTNESLNDGYSSNTKKPCIYKNFPEQMQYLSVNDIIKVILTPLIKEMSEEVFDIELQTIILQEIYLNARFQQAKSPTLCTEGKNFSPRDEPLISTCGETRNKDNNIYCKFNKMKTLLQEIVSNENSYKPVVASEYQKKILNSFSNCFGKSTIATAKIAHSKPREDPSVMMSIKSKSQNTLNRLSQRIRNQTKPVKYAVKHPEHKIQGLNNRKLQKLIQELKLQRKNPLGFINKTTLKNIYGTNIQLENISNIKPKENETKMQIKYQDGKQPPVNVNKSIGVNLLAYIEKERFTEPKLQEVWNRLKQNETELVQFLHKYSNINKHLANTLAFDPGSTDPGSTETV